MSEAAIAARRKNSAVALSLDVAVRRIVERAPELTDQQKAALRSLLASPDGGAER